MVNAPENPKLRPPLADQASAVIGRVPRPAQRLLDVVAASLTLLLLAPLVIGRAAAALVRERRLFDRRLCAGLGGKPFALLQFAGPFPLAGLAVWWNVLRGQMALVGPRPVSRAEAGGLSPAAMARFQVPPGLISPYAVRSQVGIAHRDEYSQDLDYVQQASLANDLGLLLRHWLGWLLRSRGKPLRQLDTLSIFGVRMDNTTMQAALDGIISASAPAQPPTQLAFVNPDCLNIAWRNPDYTAVLQGCERVFPDGIGLRIGGRMLGVELRDNVNGTDLFPLLCEAAAGAGRRLYLLGARPGVAAAAAQAMQARYPTLRIAGTRDGYFAVDQEAEVIAEINASGASILLVAFGAPRQEFWIAQHRAMLSPPVAMGVGGLFDFYSGRIQRAPLWMREIGMEWVYRLLQEPGRMWRRYIIGNPVFLCRVWQQRRDPSRVQSPRAHER